MSIIFAAQTVGGHPTFPSSLRTLASIKITVPTEPFNPANTGLQKLHRLVVTPIRKVGVRHSLFLMCCIEHNAVGYRVEGISGVMMLQALLTPAKMNPLKPCHACDERSSREGTSRPRLPLLTLVPVTSPTSLGESEPHLEHISVTLPTGDSVPHTPYGFNLTPDALP